jgi:hypothetical protein
MLQTARPISRFLYPPKRAATIPLGLSLLRGSSDLPGSRNGAGHSSSPIWSCFAWGFPCRSRLLGPRCALTAPFHPYPPGEPGRRCIFCGTIRGLRFQRKPPAVSRHAALRRPDFPPGTPANGIVPSGCPAAQFKFQYGIRTTLMLGHR